MDSKFSVSTDKLSTSCTGSSPLSTSPSLLVDTMAAAFQSGPPLTAAQSALYIAKNLHHLDTKQKWSDTLEGRQAAGTRNANRQENTQTTLQWRGCREPGISWNLPVEPSRVSSAELIANWSLLVPAGIALNSTLCSPASPLLRLVRPLRPFLVAPASWSVS